MKTWLLMFMSSFSFYGYLCGQILSDPQRDYLQKHLQIISKDSAVDQCQWERLAGHLKNKNLVLIGENNHGSKEIFQWRNDLIRHLHQKEGFNTVLFESGFGELLPGQEKESALSPLQMTRSLFGGWRSPEFKDLMAYIKSEQMAWGGIDVQRSGGGFREILNRFCGEYGVDTVMYQNLEGRYGFIHGQLNNRKSVYDSIQAITSDLMRDYQILSNRISELPKNSSLHRMMLIHQTLQNRVVYLNYMLQFVKDKDWHHRWARRDSMMAENLIFLRRHIYPTQKIIVIAHNYHISKINEQEETMGEILNDLYQKDLYVLGVYAGGGSYADNSGKTVSMQAPDTTLPDIKHLIGAMKGYAGFIHLPSKNRPGNQWLFNPMVVNDSFIDLNGTNQLILPKHFDGLLLLKHVSPAVPIE